MAAASTLPNQIRSTAGAVPVFNEKGKAQYLLIHMTCISLYTSDTNERMGRLIPTIVDYKVNIPLFMRFHTSRTVCCVSVFVHLFSV